jgi:hypothetical protein
MLLNNKLHGIKQVSVSSVSATRSCDMFVNAGHYPCIIYAEAPMQRQQQLVIPYDWTKNRRLCSSAAAAGVAAADAATFVGFYPRILRVEAPVKYQQVAGGAMRVESDAASIKFFERGLGRVWIHPASVCFKAGSYSSGGSRYT